MLLGLDVMKKKSIKAGRELRGDAVQSQATVISKNGFLKAITLGIFFPLLACERTF